MANEELERLWSRLGLHTTIVRNCSSGNRLEHLEDAILYLRMQKISNLVKILEKKKNHVKSSYDATLLALQELCPASTDIQTYLADVESKSKTFLADRARGRVTRTETLAIYISSLKKM